MTVSDANMKILFARMNKLGGGTERILWRQLLKAEAVNEVRPGAWFYAEEGTLFAEPIAKTAWGDEYMHFEDAVDGLHALGVIATRYPPHPLLIKEVQWRVIRSANLDKGWQRWLKNLHTAFPDAYRTKQFHPRTAGGKELPWSEASIS